jgi:hypothetical protein
LEWHLQCTIGSQSNHFEDFMRNALSRLSSATVLFVTLAALPQIHCGGGLNQGTDDGSSQFSLPAPWSGIRQVGVAGAQSLATGVATDAAGNLYVVGQTNGSLEGAPFKGTQDFFLLKYDVSGNLLWVREAGAAGKPTIAYSVAVSASGAVYVAGNTQGGIDVPTTAGMDDFFLARFTSDGHREWVRQMGGGGGYAEARGVVADDAGNAYITGVTNVGLNGNTQRAGMELFIGKYDPSGNISWLHQVGGGAAASGSTTRGMAIALDPTGGVHVVGDTDAGTIGGALTGSIDLLILKYTSSGSRVRTRLLGAASEQTEGYGIAADVDGGVYVTGTQTGTTSTDVILSRYDAAGTFKWTRKVGVPGGNSAGKSVSISPAGLIHVAGDTFGAGLNGGTQSGILDAFIMQYDSSGTHRWTHQFGSGTGNTTLGMGVATDSKNGVFVVGSTTARVPNGPPMTGAEDLFVAKYDSAGTLQ